MTTVEMFAIEEVSQCAAKASRRLFKGANFTAADLLRNRLDEEAVRYVVPQWTAYKAELEKVEALLVSAGVPDDTARWAIAHLDEQAVGLYTAGQSRALEQGLEVGQKLATQRPFTLMLPGIGPGSTRGLVQPESGLMLVYVPDDGGDAA